MTQIRFAKLKIIRLSTDLGIFREKNAQRACRYRGRKGCLSKLLMGMQGHVMDEACLPHLAAMLFGHFSHEKCPLVVAYKTIQASRRVFFVQCLNVPSLYRYIVRDLQEYELSLKQ